MIGRLLFNDELDNLDKDELRINWTREMHWRRRSVVGSVNYGVSATHLRVTRDARVRSDWVPVRLGIQSDWAPIRLGIQSDWVLVRLGIQSDWVSSPTGYRSDWVSSPTGYRSDWVLSPTGWPVRLVPSPTGSPLLINDIKWIL